MNDELTYVPYHIHTELSNGVTNIDSITNFNDYIEACKECDIKALGFSEHGSLFHWLHKKEAIEKAGMKYIHCIEVYITEDNSDNCAVYEAKDLIYGITVTFDHYDISEDGKYIVNVLRDNYPVLKSKETTSKYVSLWIDESTIRVKYNKTRDNYHCILISKNYDGVKELNE